MLPRCMILTVSLWGCAVPPGQPAGGGDALPSSPEDATVGVGDSRPVAVDAVAMDAAAIDAAAIDAAAIDAAALDAAALDLGADASDLDADASPEGPRDATPADAAPADAMTEAPDTSWGPCVVGATAGRCVQVARCGEGHRSIPGHCPGPAAIRCCIPVADAQDCDPSVLRPQPLPDAPPPTGEGCPAEMVAVADFCVDRYEAALMVEGVGWSPYHNPGEQAAIAVSRAGVVPQGYINGHQAEAACVGAGKRLCTDAEWLRACGGLEAWAFPYGPAREPGRCNDARALHPAVERFPHAENPFALIGDACINQLAESVDPTGHREGCATPEGVYDLMGNLHEWTSAPTGTFRGGFYVDTVRNGPGCLYATTAHDRNHWDYSTGFRCCAARR